MKDLITIKIFRKAVDESDTTSEGVTKALNAQVMPQVQELVEALDDIIRNANSKPLNGLVAKSIAQTALDKFNREGK